MEGKNWGEFEKNKCKLENKCNKLFIRQQKTFEEKAKNKHKNLKISTIMLMTLKSVQKKKDSKMKSQFLNNSSYLKMKWTSLRKKNQEKR